MRRLALIAALALTGVAMVVGACEDDSLYKAGGPTFQNDTVDGAAGATGSGVAGASGQPSGQAGPDAGP